MKKIEATSESWNFDLFVSVASRVQYLLAWLLLDIRTTNRVVLCDITAMFIVFVVTNKHQNFMRHGHPVAKPNAPPSISCSVNSSLATTFHMNTLRNLNSQAAAGHMRYEPGHFWSKTNIMEMHNWSIWMHRSHVSDQGHLLSSIIHFIYLII